MNAQQRTAKALPPAQQESGGVPFTLTPPPVEQPPFQSAHANEPTIFKDTKAMPQKQSPVSGTLFSELSEPATGVVARRIFFIHQTS